MMFQSLEQIERGEPGVAREDLKEELINQNGPEAAERIRDAMRRNEASKSIPHAEA
jgi:hypothetical protein